MSKMIQNKPTIETQDKIGIKIESHLWYGTFKILEYILRFKRCLNNQPAKHKKRKALFDG